MNQKNSRDTENKTTLVYLRSIKKQDKHLKFVYGIEEFDSLDEFFLDYYRVFQNKSNIFDSPFPKVSIDLRTTEDM